jgi:amino-acid N-acetyltransferase
MSSGPHQNAPAFSIQAAKAKQAEAIRKLILEVDINPHGLDWQRFLVAITPQDELIGCGQIKQHEDGTRELASIAVDPEWRKRGVARAIIEGLIASQSGELFLMTGRSMREFYEKFGFQEIGFGRMPKYFRRVSQMPAIVAEFKRVGDQMMIMKRPAA